MQDQRGVKVPEMQALKVELAVPALSKGIRRRAAEGNRPGLAYFDNKMVVVEHLRLP